MRTAGPTAHADIVLLLRGVSISLHAGVDGCRASARVLVAVDLTLRRGDRVVVVNAPADATTQLLLVAAGVRRPDAGAVWCAPGARLVCRANPGAVVRGVAERRVGGIDAIRWSGDAGVAELAFGDAHHDRRRLGTRRLRFHRGALRPAAGDGRVDSAFGAL